MFRERGKHLPKYLAPWELWLEFLPFFGVILLLAVIALTVDAVTS